MAADKEGTFDLNLNALTCPRSNILPPSFGTFQNLCLTQVSSSIQIQHAFIVSICRLQKMVGILRGRLLGLNNLNTYEYLCIIPLLLLNNMH